MGSKFLKRVGSACYIGDNAAGLILCFSCLISPNGYSFATPLVADGEMLVIGWSAAASSTFGTDRFLAPPIGSNCYPALLFGLIIGSLKSLTFGSFRYLLRRSFISTEPPGIRDDWALTFLADLPPFCIKMALGELTWFCLFELRALHFISGSCKLFLVSTELLSDTFSRRSLSSCASSLFHRFCSWADFLLVYMLSVKTNSLSSFDCSTRIFALMSGNAILCSLELKINRGTVQSWKSSSQFAFCRSL